MVTSSDDLLTDKLRRADPDRFFCTLFAPAAVRRSLAILYLFNHEIARAAEVASEPVLALIRLAWWQEVVEGARRPHEVATPLREALDAGVFDAADLIGLVEARRAEVDKPESVEGFLAYVRGTAGGLAAVAGKIIGGEQAGLANLGTAYGIAGVMRGRRWMLPSGVDEAALRAEVVRLLGDGRIGNPAGLVGALARWDVRGRRPGLGRKLAVLAASVRGRV
jgi:phytoene synthase